MLKRELFEELHNKSIFLTKQPQVYKDFLRTALRREYGDIEEIALEKFVKDFCSYVSKQLSKLKGISLRKKNVHMLNNDSYTVFFNTEIELPLKSPPPPTSFSNIPKNFSSQTKVSWLRLQKRKRDSEGKVSPSKKRNVSSRQHAYDAQDVRDWAVSSEAIHLASAQEFSKAGYWDAFHVSKQLSENPEKYGPYLRDALKRMNSEKEPKVPVMKSLSLYYFRKLSVRTYRHIRHGLLYNGIGRSLHRTGPAFTCLKT